jgi:hypothetical protein
VKPARARLPITDLLFRWRKLVLSANGPTWSRPPSKRNPTPRKLADKNVRLTLSALANYMDVDGTNAFPSQELLAVSTGLTTRAVKDALERAAQSGWILRHRIWMHNLGMKRFRYAYRVRFPAVNPEPSSGERSSPGGMELHAIGPKVGVETPPGEPGAAPGERESSPGEPGSHYQANDASKDSSTALVEGSQIGEERKVQLERDFAAFVNERSTPPSGQALLAYLKGVRAAAHYDAARLHDALERGLQLRPSDPNAWLKAELKRSGGQP